MHLARVVGTLHATVKDPNVTGAKLLVLQPIDMHRRPVGSRLAAADTVGAGLGEIVFYTTAYEAVIPFRRVRPGTSMALVDASVIGIVDAVHGAES